MVILLLLSFSVQITGYHLFFRYKQSDIKRAAKRKLRRGVDPALTEVFEFPLASDSPEEMPEWIDKHEFRFKGGMYDVIEKRTEGGRMIVRCLNDKKEKELISYYKDLVKKDFGEKARKRSSLFIKLISTAYTTTGINLVNIPSGAAGVNADMRRLALLFVPSEVPTPPPQAA